MPFCTDKVTDAELRKLGELKGWSRAYGKALLVLARRGALIVVPEGPRREALQASLKHLQDDLYVPRVGDMISWESNRSGVRYHCKIKKVCAETGMLFDDGSGSTFDPNHGFVCK